MQYKYEDSYDATTHQIGAAVLISLEREEKLFFLRTRAVFFSLTVQQVPVVRTVKKQHGWYHKYYRYYNVRTCCTSCGEKCCKKNDAFCSLSIFLQNKWCIKN